MTSYSLEDGFQFPLCISPNPKKHRTYGSGYRVNQEVITGKETPVITLAVTKEEIFNVFISLLEKFSDLLDIYIDSNLFSDLESEVFHAETDKIAFISKLIDVENQILNDPKVTLSVTDKDKGIEIRLDRKKLIYIFSESTADQDSFVNMLIQLGFGELKPDHIFISQDQIIYHIDPFPESDLLDSLISIFSLDEITLSS